MCPAPDHNKPVRKPPPDHNPADEGLPHPFVHGDERDREESPVRKQEAEQGRGEDNEDDTASEDLEEK